MRNLFVLFVFCMLLTGCTGLPALKRLDAANENTDERNPHAEINNVEVISVLPDSFDLVHLGATRFTNRYYQSDTSQWAINNFVEGLVIEAIRHDQQFNYVDSGIDKDRFGTIYTGNRSSEKFLDIKNVSSELEELYRVHNIDTLVLIVENKIEDPIKDTTQDFMGYGLYQNASLFKSVYLYSYLRVIVVDTRTREIKKEVIVTDYMKLPKVFWAKQLDLLPSREMRYLRNESLKMAGRNVLGALVDSNLINKEAVYTTERGTRFVADRSQEAGNYGELYEDAVDRIYVALNIEKHFERYALLMRGRHEEVIDQFYPYRDVYLDWMQEHVNWEILKPKMIDEYRKEFTADELNEIADFAETEVGAKMLEKIPLILSEQENIWLREAKSKVGILDDAILRRRAKTEY